MKPGPSTSQPTILFSRRSGLIGVGISCFAVFTWMIWLSQDFPPQLNPAEVGAARVPMIAAIGGITASVVIILQALRHRHIHRNDETDPSARLIEIRRPLAVLAALILVIVWAEAMSRVGFYMTSAFVVPVIMLAGGERRPRWLVLSTIGFLLFVHFCFAYLLNIEFP